PLLAHSGHLSLHRTCPLLGVKRTFHGVAFQSSSAHYRTRAWQREYYCKQSSLLVAHSTPTNSNKTKGQARVFRREGHYAPFISSLARAENPLDNRFTGSNHSCYAKCCKRTAKTV